MKKIATIISLSLMCAVIVIGCSVTSGKKTKEIKAGDPTPDPSGYGFTANGIPTDAGDQEAFDNALEECTTSCGNTCNDESCLESCVTNCLEQAEQACLDSETITDAVQEECDCDYTDYQNCICDCVDTKGGTDQFEACEASCDALRKCDEDPTAEGCDKCTEDPDAEGCVDPATISLTLAENGQPYEKCSADCNGAGSGEATSYMISSPGNNKVIAGIRIGAVSLVGLEDLDDVECLRVYYKTINKDGTLSNVVHVDEDFEGHGTTESDCSNYLDSDYSFSDSTILTNGYFIGESCTIRAQFYTRTILDNYNESKKTWLSSDGTWEGTEMTSGQMDIQFDFSLSQPEGDFPVNDYVIVGLGFGATGDYVSANLAWCKVESHLKGQELLVSENSK